MELDSHPSLLGDELWFQLSLVWLFLVWAKLPFRGVFCVAEHFAPSRGAPDPGHHYPQNVAW